MKHVAVIVASAGKILSEKLIVDRIDGCNLIVGIRGGCREHRSAAFCRIVESLALLCSDAQPHAVDKYHIVSAGILQVFDREFFQSDE